MHVLQAFEYIGCPPDFIGKQPRNLQTPFKFYIEFVEEIPIYMRKPRGKWGRVPRSLGNRLLTRDRNVWGIWREHAEYTRNIWLNMNGRVRYYIFPVIIVQDLGRKNIRVCVASVVWIVSCHPVFKDQGA